MNMAVKSKYTSNGSIGKGVLWGCLASFVITLGMSMILAGMISREKLPEGAMGYGVMFTLITASLLGGHISCRKVKNSLLATSLITGGLYFAILFLLTLVVWGGDYNGIGETVLLILCGSILSAMWNSRNKSTLKLKKMKIANR